IRSIFELNSKYGWSKFIIVVPSIAIREGVKKSFEMTQEHFKHRFGKTVKPFVYDSSERGLKNIDDFAKKNEISVMIINVQAFNARGEGAKRIYLELDEFCSRKPIDVIAKNRPIIIRDEPQKQDTVLNMQSLQKFNPLFVLNFSATHKNKNNTIYVLDAFDAYKNKLVKKVEVKGIEMVNRTGTNGYLHLCRIEWDSNGKPCASLEFEKQYKEHIKKQIHKFRVDDDIYQESKLEQYKQGYSIVRINAQDSCIELSSGQKLFAGQALGSVNAKDIRRIQIRETIRSHFEKERDLFAMGIKVLSLFFIDEVINYRDYDQADEMGEYAIIFEEEYNQIINEYITLDNPNYSSYLKKIATKDTHKGYFSIDKKGGKERFVDSIKGKSKEESDDISAYDLILKDKERLLSLEEPTRFIFSHSALREGWDNPNVFQICALKPLPLDDKNIRLRQEIGRGLRIAVNCFGERMDSTYPKINFFDVNKLTFVTESSFAKVASRLQQEWSDALHIRPIKISVEYWKGKSLLDNQGNKVVVDDSIASRILVYLEDNQYIDEKGELTPKIKQELNTQNGLVEMPTKLQPLATAIINLIKDIVDNRTIEIDDVGTKAPPLQIKDENFAKFRQMWKQINKKYAYTVEFDSKELIQNAILKIDSDLFVSRPKYTIGIVQQNIDKLQFSDAKTTTKDLSIQSSTIKYDLLGKLCSATSLTRQTICEILKGIGAKAFCQFAINPEEFIVKVASYINDEKATMVVNHIVYNQIDGEYEDNIFTLGQSRADIKKIVNGQKSITNYFVADGSADESVEKRFSKELDSASEVSVYAKLPNAFRIPTPMGDYNPDWAIVFCDKSGIKHIYFIAETKGTMDSLSIRPIEKAKIQSAKSLYNTSKTTLLDISQTNHVRYHNVADYKTLLEVMGQIE
ncbi:MAG: DEAD/DEAH box helicase family protein, partial [Firmicutes bacterium]|nr:DEAD/DEAH box helicase family protein [Bacillota bacterium]